MLLERLTECPKAFSFWKRKNRITAATNHSHEDISKLVLETKFYGKVLQLWILRMLLLTPARFTTITKLLCLLNKTLPCRKSHRQDRYKLRNTRTKRFLLSIDTAKPFSQMTSLLERIFLIPASSTSKGKHPTTQTESSCLKKNKSITVMSGNNCE